MNKSASLELIAKANGKLTGDELRQQAEITEQKERKQFSEQDGRYFSKRERCRLRKMQRENDESQRGLEV